MIGIILPRQARDKHRGKAAPKKRDDDASFLQRDALGLSRKSFDFFGSNKKHRKFLRKTSAVRGKNTPFWRRFYIKNRSILPRQARDKRLSHAQKERCGLRREQWRSTRGRARCTTTRRRSRRSSRRSRRRTTTTTNASCDSCKKDRGAR